MVGNWIFPHPSDDRLQVFEEKIDYRFTDRLLAREALQSPNSSNEDGNRTFALIGDKVIDLVIVTTGRKNNKTRSKHTPWLLYLISLAYDFDSE